jgi:hypothetical protein
MRWLLAAGMAVLLSGCALPSTYSADDVSPVAVESAASASSIGPDYAALGRMANVRLSFQRHGGRVPERLCRDAWRNLRAQPQWAALPDQPPPTFLVPCQED